MNKQKQVENGTLATYFDTHKESAVLFIICGKLLLLQKSEQQGGIIYDAFGTFLGGDDAYSQLMRVQQECIGSSFDMRSSGTLVAYINKPLPDGRVQLSTQVYVARINEEEKSALRLDQKQFWIDIETINNTDKVREDDKILFTRALEGKNLNLITEVDQPGLWVEAKLLAWAEA